MQTTTVIKLKNSTLIGVGQTYAHHEAASMYASRFNAMRSEEDKLSNISFGTIAHTHEDYQAMRDRTQHLGSEGQSLPMWLLIKDEPFRGYAHSMMMEDGTIQFNEQASLEEHERYTGHTFRLIDAEEYDQLEADYNKTLKTSPSEITLERFEEMLNILPPARWHTDNGVELFHISEHISGPMVSWFAKTKDRCFEFIDSARCPSHTLSRLILETLSR